MDYISDNEFELKHFVVKHLSDRPNVKVEDLIFAAKIDKSFVRALSVGSNLGLETMVLSQNSTGSIVAVEPIEDLYETSNSNFTHSIFKNRIELMNKPLKEFSQLKVNQTYDLIFSNPFSSCRQKSTLKDVESISLNDILEICKIHLSPEGKLWIIVPVNKIKEVKATFSGSNLNIGSYSWIKSRPCKQARAVILQISKQLVFDETSIAIYEDDSKQYTSEIIELLKDYLLRF